MNVNAQEIQDLRDTALKLDEIRTYFPEDYCYLKGWINGRLHKEAYELNNGAVRNAVRK